MLEHVVGRRRSYQRRNHHTPLLEASLVRPLALSEHGIPSRHRLAKLDQLPLLLSHALLERPDQSLESSSLLLLWFRLPQLGELPTAGVRPPERRVPLQRALLDGEAELPAEQQAALALA